MSADQKPNEEVRPKNKATMDEPQEEFVADQSVPSHSKSSGAEADVPKAGPAKREPGR